MRKSIFLCLGVLSCVNALLLSPRPASAKPAALDAEDIRVVKELERVLRDRIKVPTGQLDLKIIPTDRASDGYFQEITINGSPAQLKKLHVSSFALKAKDIRINVSKLFSDHKVATYSSKTTLNALITEDDLTATLAEGKRTRTMGLKVKYLANNTLQVTGNLNMSLLSGPIDGIAKLRLAPGHQVFLDIQTLKLRGAEVPEFVKNRLSSAINPLVDYDDLPFAPPFKGVKINGKKATIFT